MIFLVTGDLQIGHVALGLVEEVQRRGAGAHQDDADGALGAHRLLTDGVAMSVGLGGGGVAGIGNGRH